MFKKSKVNAGVLAALGGALLAVGLPAAAQTTQRIEVTGTAIKRVDAESALPIQVITTEDIKRTGVTSVTDLIQSLPAMQGFLTSSNSINGGGGGATNASLHAIGSSYTLVLLNGRRVAPYNTGSTVNLNSIPLSAIERVEVLTDGASALYGSDAIAGVVNFITKKDSTEGLVSATGYAPQHPGGGSGTVSISKGFGDLTRDGFNVLLSASFDKQQKLDASQRDYTKTGILSFFDEGAQQSAGNPSSNSVPGNARSVKLTDGSTINFSPYLAKNGACPAGQIKSGTQCFFDFAATVESIPASQRTSLFGSARFEATKSLSIFSELGWSSFYNDPRYAPPAQPGLPLPAAVIASDINPYLAQLGHPGATATSATVNLRLFDAGGRQDRYKTDALHFVLGADATVGSFDLTGTYTHSGNKFTDSAEGGYASVNGFNALVANGTFNPLTATAGSAVGILAPVVLHQVIDSSKSSIDVLSGRGSTTLGKLEGGDIGLGAGLDYTRQKYSDDPSAILQGQNALQPNYTDSILGGGGGALPFDSTRNNYGVYAELVLPVLKTLEISGSARYDSYDAIKNSKNFDANGNPLPAATQGKKNSSGTYKLSLRFQPTKELLLRGSVGTGFKAPTMQNITFPLQAFGNTGFHNCPPGLSAAKAALCPPNLPDGTPVAQEYNIQQGGNPSSGADALKPEKSTQWTIGFRFEPMPAISFGADLWTVKIKDQINSVSEDTAFSNGAQYENLFKVAPDPVTGTPTLTFLSVPVNTGDAYYQGIDLDVESRVGTPIGKLTSRLRGTYMIRADYQTPGTPGFINSMSKVGPDTLVTFRYLVNLSATLESGPFTNTLSLNYKPGYKDDTADYTRADGSPRDVSDYTLVDWQGRYAFNKALSVTLGIKNLFDTKPPFTVLDQPGTSNARGVDSRYTDLIGRQFYLGAEYKF